LVVQSRNNDLWGLPKGGPDYHGETFHTIIRREVLEETGLCHWEWESYGYIGSFRGETDRPRGYGLRVKEFHLVRGVAFRDPSGFSNKEIKEVRLVRSFREFDELPMRPDRRVALMAILLNLGEQHQLLSCD